VLQALAPPFVHHSPGRTVWMERCSGIKRNEQAFALAVRVRSAPCGALRSRY